MSSSIVLSPPGRLSIHWSIVFCLCVCIRSVRILHGAAVFDRDRRYGPTALTSILLDISVRVTLPKHLLTGAPIVETYTDTRDPGAIP